MKSTKPTPTKSKLALREPGAPLKMTDAPLRDDHPMSLIVAQSLVEPVRPANPSAEQTPPPAEPVAVSDRRTRPERTGSPPEPVRHTNGYIGVTNHLLDDVLPTLEPQDQVVLLRLYRLTRGHRKNRCKVSRGKLIAKTGVKKTRLLQALVTLEERGFIERLADDVASADVYDRGMSFEMKLEGVEPVREVNPSGMRTRPPHEPNKIEDQKKDFKEGARCAKCQDTGFFYPNGTDKGVVRCTHT